MIAALIQARMTSTRLPGKILADVNGRPMLARMFERVKAAGNIDKIMLVTSTDSSDDPVVELCRREGILCYRGSLDDVLDRYYQAARFIKADVIVRLTGDCPLIDPTVIDLMVDVYHDKHCDYAANSAPPPGTFPDGMDVEVFSFQAIEKAWCEANKPSHREHVTFYLWQNPHLFSLFRYDLNEDLSSIRLTVDYPEDMDIIREIYNRLYERDPLFTMKDILDLLQAAPEIRERNKDIERNKGWASALAKDRQQEKN
jgi:spore coat polysaccharide biosynthesis protein SpsF (cytidylyltransferase family)